MADPTGFMTTPREVASRRPVDERLGDWNEVYPDSPGMALLPIISKQAGRCMDCGIPFCHNGCPLGNLIPEWNDQIWRDEWQLALDRLHATNNFPEFTGRLCPAPCETACVVGINRDPVTIKNVEVAIIDKGWADRRVVPQLPNWHTLKTVAVIGSGPAGLAVAQQLTRAGHTVVVYERADAIGGLLRYGIPNFKMEKSVSNRRLKQMVLEGTTSVHRPPSASTSPASNCSSVSTRSCWPSGRRVRATCRCRGRELAGIHQRWTTWTQATKASRWPGRGPNQCGGQGRHRDRRRRHLQRLPGHGTASGCLVGDPVGDHAPPAGAASGYPALAHLPDALSNLLGERGGWRPASTRSTRPSSSAPTEKSAACGWSRSADPETWFA